MSLKKVARFVKLVNIIYMYKKHSCNKKLLSIIKFARYFLHIRQFIPSDFYSFKKTDGGWEINHKGWFPCFSFSKQSLILEGPIKIKIGAWSDEYVFIADNYALYYYSNKKQAKKFFDNYYSCVNEINYPILPFIYCDKKQIAICKKVSTPNDRNLNLEEKILEWQ